jgi:nucleotide-binding universal stress UspA family protein
MCKTILLVIEGISADRAMVEHIKPLAKLAQSREILFQLGGSATKASEELERLGQIYREFQSAGIPVEFEMAYGDPVAEIVQKAQQKGCDLIALVTCKGRSITDHIFGPLASRVQDSVRLPVLLFRQEQTN